MNTEQFWSLVRSVLISAGGGLVLKGYVDAGTMTAIVGALVTILSAGYGIYTKRKAGLIASAAALPDVSHIITTQKIAAASPSEKVVSQTPTTVVTL